MKCEEKQLELYLIIYYNINSSLDKVNSAVQNAQGNVIYLDKTAKHMYELNNRVRLINVSEYPIQSTEAFFGFLYGIISQDHDLEQVYLDSFLKLSCLEGKNITPAISELELISSRYHVDFTLSVSADEEELDASVRSRIIISL